MGGISGDTSTHTHTRTHVQTCLDFNRGNFSNFAFNFDRNIEIIFKSYITNTPYIHIMSRDSTISHQQKEKKSTLVSLIDFLREIMEQSILIMECNYNC